MRSGYSTKEIKDVINTLKRMGINAKQAGVSKTGSLKMKEKKNIYTFSRVGGDIVSLNLDGFPPVRPFSAEDAAARVQECLAEDTACDIRVASCDMDGITVSVSCHGLKFEYTKALSGYERDNLTYEEIAENIRTGVYEEAENRFCEKKNNVIDREVTNAAKRLGYGDLIDSRGRYSRIIGDEIGRMFRFAGKKPDITPDGFILSGSGFSVRYKTAGTKIPEIFDTAAIDRAKDTAESINSHIWKNDYIDDIVKYISSKPDTSAVCSDKLTSLNIDTLENIGIKVKYETKDFIFDDTFSIPLIENGYEEMKKRADEEYDRFVRACEEFTQKEKEKKTAELEEAGLCYQILPYAIYRVVEENNDAVTENMVYNNLFGQKRGRKVKNVEGFTGKFRHIQESRVADVIRDMKNAGVLREVYHINELNNRFYFLALEETYRDCLPKGCRDSVEDILAKDTGEWTDFDWIAVIRYAKPDCFDMKEWLRLMEVFHNEDVCLFCENELAGLFSEAPQAISAYLEAADVGAGFSRVKRKMQNLH